MDPAIVHWITKRLMEHVMCVPFSKRDNQMTQSARMLKTLMVLIVQLITENNLHMKVALSVDHIQMDKIIMYVNA